MQISRENILKEKMVKGINLFLGSGFSILPSPDGKALPTANQLKTQLIDEYKLNVPNDVDLATVSELSPKTGYQKLLRSLFRVNSYNPKYAAINQINIKSIITTNIDNLIHAIMDDSNRYYLRSMLTYGAIKLSQNEIPYIPLHGDVTSIDTTLIFGKFDVAIADHVNADLFKQAKAKMLEAPTIFWGYSFQDSGVLRTIKSVFEDHAQDIWVQCMPSDTSTQQIFSQAGCNLIICDTEQLLDWITNNVNEAGTTSSNVPSLKIPASLKQFSIPSINLTDVVSINDFYRLGKTYWYNILCKHATELKVVNDLYDKALKSKNVILVGSHFSGRTTSLMQLACKVSDDFKLYLTNPTIEEAKFVLHHIGTNKYWVFIEDCSNDIEVYRLFAKTQNITLIGECDEYSFESAKHVLSDVKFIQLTQCDLSYHEALSLYDNIPASLRLEHFTFKLTHDEKYSMLELMMQNVSGVITKERIDKILLEIFDKDRTVFATIVLTVYLSERKSALSTDIMWSFFNAESYSQIRTVLERTNSFLSHLDVSIDPEMNDQDYFQLRSKFFLSLTSDILESNSKYRKEYERVIRKFIRNVSPIKIYNYHVFKRLYIDSEFIYKIFKRRAIDIYEEVYNYDRNPYVLQQWALYYSRCKDYKSAFGCIDRAIQAVPNSFSMQNSKAIILFEANRYGKTDIVIRQQRESMDILKRCYLSDKKKLYHAQKYAEFAIFLASEKSIFDYINQAFEWLTEASANTAESNKTKTLLQDLTEILQEVSIEENPNFIDN